MKYLLIILLLSNVCQAQVNVFLGTSGDHGQLSPGACAPFGLINVAPETYPRTHTGYDHRAKTFLGFTHDRLEGVGCMGSGGSLLIKPMLNNTPLISNTERAGPGHYAVSFNNGLAVTISVKGNTATEHYTGQQQLFIDLSHAHTNGFIAERHQWTKNNTLSGWIELGTTCRFGSYKTYYTIAFDQPFRIADSTAHSFMLNCLKDLTLRVHYAAHPNDPFENQADWATELAKVKVSGNKQEQGLFYSLLYRCLQAPMQTGPHTYSGWSIWDNYRTELPLLSLIEPGRYQDIVNSVAALYPKGRHDWAGRNEQSNTVRTEHAIIVLLDAYRKGYRVDFQAIRDSLIAENERLDFRTPDKALESSYDTWALAQILAILKEDHLADQYFTKASQWKNYWDKDFKDLSKRDIDQLGARQMYQGTILQYRWLVPYDLQGLIQACGGEPAFIKQLDHFFAGDYYCASNEPDLQAPYLYNATSQPWKSQAAIRHYAQDTVVQYYQDENYRDIGAEIQRVYNNQPDGYLQTMDDDLGELSSWYVMAAIGLSPACVGTPVYYLHVPIFKTVTIGQFSVKVTGQGRYIRSATLNGKPLERNWITQQEIRGGGQLIIHASNQPNLQFGLHNQFITSITNH